MKDLGRNLVTQKPTTFACHWYMLSKECRSHWNLGKGVTIYYQSSTGGKELSDPNSVAKPWKPPKQKGRKGHHMTYSISLLLELKIKKSQPPVYVMNIKNSLLWPAFDLGIRMEPLRSESSQNDEISMFCHNIDWRSWLRQHGGRWLAEMRRQLSMTVMAESRDCPSLI